MNSFEYLGRIFTGYRNLDKKNEQDFQYISSKIVSVQYISERDGYSYSEFYRKAKENDCYFDLYKIDNLTVIPLRRGIAIIKIT